MIEEKFVDDAHKFNLENISRDFTLKELALLILLGTEQSLSTYNLFYFDLIKEADTLADEFPVHFEINYYEYHLSALDSNYKLTSNSKYSLLKHLGEYAKHAENYKNILDAYEYIYIYIYEKIESTESEFNTPRKMLDYIKFDVLNDIFYMNNRTVIELIKYIYEGLEGVMNVNPQFKHQRAKSILWLCRDNFDDVKDAANYVDLARYDVQNLLKRKYNEKLKISLEHIKYTQASIYGRMCAISNYKDANMVQKSLFYYKEALMSTENSNEREEIIKKKAQKYIYEDFQNLLKHISTHKDAYSNLLDDVEFLVNELRISL